MSLQLLSDLHGAFVGCQESISTASPPNSQDVAKIKETCLKGLARYRLVLRRHFPEAAGPAALTHLLEIVLAGDGLGTLVTWLDANFPVDEAAAEPEPLSPGWWSLIFQWLVRQRYDRVCLSLQVAQEAHPRWAEALRSFTDLLLSYPSARQRKQHPHLLDEWQAEASALLKTQNGWPADLTAALGLVARSKGAFVPARHHLRHWQEHLVLALLLNPTADLGRLAEECLGNFEGNQGSTDQAVVCLLSGHLAQFLRLLEPFHWLSPHLIDVLWHAGILTEILGDAQAARDLHQRSLMEWADSLAKGPFWNLAADYLWTLGEPGQARLESLLFELSMRTAVSEQERQEAILDVAQNFGLSVLAGAIHVALGERALDSGDLQLALRHALDAGQPALVTRVCDEFLSPTKPGGARTAEIEGPLWVDENLVIDQEAFPRFQLLLRYQHFQQLLPLDPAAALRLFSDQILPMDRAGLIPSHFKTRLLEDYQRLSGLVPTLLPALSTVGTLLGFLDQRSETSDPELIQQSRVLLVHQAAHALMQ